MSNIKEKQENPTTQHSEDELQALLKELWSLEKSLFPESDWIVDWSSNDSDVDKQFLEQAKELKNKKDIVLALLYFFENPENIKIFNDESYKTTINKFPQFKSILDNLILKNVDIIPLIWKEKFFEFVNKTFSSAEENDKLWKILDLQWRYNWTSVFEEYFNFFLSNNWKSSEIFSEAFILENSQKNLKKDSHEWFYIDRLLGYSFIKENSDDTIFLSICIREFNNLPDLSEFEKIYNEEKSKQNPDLNRFIEYISKIDDFWIKYIFVKRLGWLFSNVKPPFEEIYNKAMKDKNFWFIDKVWLRKDLHDIFSEQLSYMTEYEVSIVKPLIEDIYSWKIKKWNELEEINRIISSLSDSGYASPFNFFPTLITHLTMEFNDVNDQNLQSIFENIQIKLREISEWNIKRNISNIEKPEYREICYNYIRDKDKWLDKNSWLEWYLRKDKSNIPEEEIKTICGIAYWTKEALWLENQETKKSEIPKDLEQKHWKQVKELIDAWAKIDQNWNLSINTPINLWVNWSIEMWENWELIYMSSLWYNFKFDKDLNKSGDKIFEIKEQMDFLDKVWFWFFWNNFRTMIETIQESSLITSNVWISIREWIWNENDFLSMSETIHICDIFKKIWFLWNEINPNNLTNPTMTRWSFVGKVWELSQKYWEDSFYNQSWNFSKIAFERVIVKEFSNKK